MRLIRRHLFSFICSIISAFAIWGWWHSSRVWMAINAETPYGIFRVQSESSMFGIGAQFMRHDHRWAINTSPDEITGDYMKFLMVPPKVEFTTDLWVLILPYWQLTLAILVFSGLIFFIEKIRIKSKLRTPT